MTFTIEQLEALKEGTTPGKWHATDEVGGSDIIIDETGESLLTVGSVADAWASFATVADGKLAAASPALLDQLITREAELQQLKMRIETLADWHGTKAMKARDFLWPGEQHAARFQGKAETHETARNKLTQILEETND